MTSVKTCCASTTQKQHIIAREGGGFGVRRLAAAFGSIRMKSGAKAPHSKAARPLLVAEGFDGVEGRGFEGRVDSEEQTD